MFLNADDSSAAYEADYSLMLYDSPDMFWKIVQTTPSREEARTMLRSARAKVAAAYADAVRYKMDSQAWALSGALSKLNAELKIVNEEIDGMEMYKAVRALFGDEGLRDVLAWMADRRMEWEGKKCS